MISIRTSIRNQQNQVFNRHLKGFTVIEFFVALAIILVLVAMILPSVRTAREPARRVHCKNNLKQISLALLNYEETYHSLPTTYTVDSDGKPLHSWRVLILPFLDQKQLYEKIDLTKPWDDPANAGAYKTTPAIYCCPNVNCAPAHSNYLAVTTSNGNFLPAQRKLLPQSTEQRGEVLMVVEVTKPRTVHWMSPQDADEKLILSLGSDTEQPHSGGWHGAFADGSTRFQISTTPESELRAMLSNGGEDSGT